MKKNMTFKEKIDKILEDNELKISSVTALEDAVKAGRGAINDFYNRNEDPGRKTLKRILSFPNLNPDWWKTGNGPVFIAGSDKNITSVQEISDNTEIPLGVSLDPESRELFKIAKKTTRYAFLPSTILDGEYRIELKSALDEKTELQKEAIAGYKKLIKRLEDEIEELRGTRNPATPQGAQ